MTYVAGVGHFSPAIDNISELTRPLGSAYGVPASGGAYPTTDLAFYIPVRVPAVVVIVKMWVGIVTAAGNIDVGIYNISGSRIVSTGLVAASTSGIFDITDTTLQRGIYYLAITATSTTMQLQKNDRTAYESQQTGIFVQQLSTGASLPSSATFASPITTSTFTVPLVGALRNGTNT